MANNDLYMVDIQQLNSNIMKEEWLTADKKYYVVDFDIPVIKLGYICDTWSINIPIYIDGVEIKLGKSCIYEVEDVEVNQVKLPNNVNFIFDYLQYK